MTLATPRIPSDFLAKRMQRLTAAAQRASHRATGAGIMLVAPAAPVTTLQRNISRPAFRSLRQAFRPLRAMNVSNDGAMRPRSPRSPIQPNTEFRTATHPTATPVHTAAARCAWLKGIEKICMVTPNDADFVR
jgi:hypothetical protein